MERDGESSGSGLPADFLICVSAVTTYAVASRNTTNNETGVTR